MSDTSYDRSPAMMAARGQTYGKRKQQEEAQRAVPMRRPPTDIQARRAARQAPLPDFFGETRRPDEPITAGAPFGPGPSPAAAGIPMKTGNQSTLEELRQIAMMSADEDLLDLLDAYEGEL
jgi:hypothetical protein